MIDYNLLPNNSRVWVYQSNQTFTDEQTATLNQKIENFIQGWQSHSHPLHAWGGVKYNRFIILVVDESFEAPSGCSIDSSVAMIKNIEQEFGVNLFDRLNFAYKTNKNEVLSADKEDFAALYANGDIDNNTTVFNNLVQTKADLESKWEIPLGDSWHRNMV